MRRLALLLFLTSCASPDAAEQALLLVDREARAAGIRVEVEGEPVTSDLPTPVSPDDDAWIVRDDRREPLLVAPGAWIEVSGPDGEIRTRPIETDRIVVAGTREGAVGLAEMLGAGMQPLGGDRYALLAPNVTWLAALFHDADVPGVRAAGFAHSSLAAELAYGDATWATRSEATFAPAVQAEELAQLPTPDTAALVGAYRYADVLLVLDAAGGYALSTSESRTTGRFRPCAGGLELVPEGGEPIPMRLWNDALVGADGFAIAPAREQNGG
jgi:hypothetical protein